MNWQKRIKERDLTVGVMGLGYVGLPLAAAFAANDFDVLGFDVDKEKVAAINDGESPLDDVDSSRIEAVSDRLSATGDMSRLGDVDTVSICVPTPLRKSRDPDISYIAQATDTLVDHFQPPGIITLESTTYPGTTEEILGDAFEQAGWTLGEDIHLAFSPERIDPGNETYGIENTPKVLGGQTEESGRLAATLYGEVIDEVVEVSSTRSAELVKLLENTFRSVNIGLANEMALLCDEMDIDVWEVIDAAATKPYGFMPFYPGPGLGGHCIPIDPLFLSWKARLHNTSSRFIELADEINRSMPDFVTGKVVDALNDDGLSVNGSRICLLGVAYKSNVGDVRESPAIEVTNNLVEKHGDVDYLDPHVPEFNVDAGPVNSVTMSNLDESEYDVGVILTDHDQFDWGSILPAFPLVVDTRNALANEDIPRGTRVVTL
jgi:UDP-N-acetyl-D-glucosamine dehydrogenase